MIAPSFFYNLLQRHDLDFFTGVPDSLLKDFCAYVTDHSAPSHHVIAANEGNAVGIATGYHLATGKIPVVYLQNSGLGNTINPLTSLTDPAVYSIPLLLVIGWRSQPGVHDEPQHIKMGAVQNDLLRALEIPFEILPDDEAELEAVFAKALAHMTDHQAPFALVVPKGVFSSHALQTPQAETGTMAREAVISAILPHIGPEDAVVATTGHTARELFELRKKANQSHAQDFLTVGSMGHCSSIALGIALAQPTRRVWCFDGDGSLLMHMGSLAVNASLAPASFVHVVLNNFAHDSVGGQPTATPHINIPQIATACGYKKTLSISTPHEIEETFLNLSKSEGPTLIEVHCKKGARADLGRPTTTPFENKTAFIQHLR